MRTVLAVALALASLPALAAELEAPGDGDAAAPPAAELSVPGVAPAAAELSAPAPPPTAMAPRKRAARSAWGLLIDAGFPEGASVSGVYRPVPSVRFWAGPAWNYVGFGVQGGIAVAPWRWALTPVLSAEAGRYFGADVSFIANGDGVPSDLKPLLDKMAYTYAALHTGIEIGSQNAFAFSLRVGLAYVSLATKGSITTTDSGGGSATFTDPRVRGTLPSVKLGVHVWF